MVIQYEDIKWETYEEIVAIAKTLRSIADRAGKTLIVEVTTSKNPDFVAGLFPVQLKEVCDCVTINGVIVKSREWEV